MKWMTFRADDAVHYGWVEDGRVYALDAVAGERYPTLLSLIQAGGLAAPGWRDAASRAPHWPLDAVTFLPPLLAPEKIWCIGVNYPKRLEEYDDSKPAAYPSLFTRAPSTLVGHGQPVLRPLESEQLDYEGEIVLVVGRAGRRIARQDWQQHIFGMTLCNEGTVRDWLRHGKFNVTQGKNFDASGSIGPWIVSADELDLSASYTLSTHVNGELRQQDETARLSFPFDYLIEYLSRFATLKPGDLIVTGTPTGAGVHQQPSAWLQPGDVVEVSVPEIGVLRNVVEQERA